MTNPVLIQTNQSCQIIETLITLLGGSKCHDWYTVNSRRYPHLAVCRGHSIAATLTNWFGAIVNYKSNILVQDDTIPGTGSHFDRAIIKFGKLITELTIMFNKGRICKYANETLLYAQVYPQPSCKPSAGQEHAAGCRNPDQVGQESGRQQPQEPGNRYHN